MVSMYELKLGRETLEALQFLLSQTDELQKAIDDINLDEVKSLKTDIENAKGIMQDIKDKINDTKSSLDKADEKIINLNALEQNIQTSLQEARNLLNRVKDGAEILINGVIDDTNAGDNKTFSSNKINSLLNTEKEALLERLTNISTTIQATLEAKLNKNVYDTDKPTFATKTELNTALNMATQQMQNALQQFDFSSVLIGDSTNTPNTVVKRDENGDFEARNISVTSIITNTQAEDNKLDENVEIAFRKIAFEGEDRIGSYVTHFGTFTKLKELLNPVINKKPTQTGYIILDNGLIIQWGRTSSITRNNSGFSSITLPIAFSNALFFAICEPNATRPTSTGFKETQIDFSGSTNQHLRIWSNYSGTDYGVHYFAIGY